MKQKKVEEEESANKEEFFRQANLDIINQEKERKRKEAIKEEEL